MTQEQKELLLKDLCARLPYGLKFKKLTKADSDIADIGATVKLYSINLESYCDIRFYTYEGKALTVCEEGRLFRPGYFLRYKPYLFPLSSMTDEQKYDFYCRFIENECDFDDFKEYYLDNGMWHKLLTTLNDIESIIDWFHKNHFDYRGLIPMGLAIDATGLNIY